MVYFFLILTMVSLILFIIGLINPSLVIVRLKKRRFLVILIYGSIALVSLLLLIITSPPPRPTLPSKDELPTVNNDISGQNISENLTDQKQSIFNCRLVKRIGKVFFIKEPEPEQYVLLSISLVTRFDQIIEIIGETDLPDGSIIEILFRQLGTPKYPNQFDLQTSAIVQNNSYQATFSAPENYLFSQGPFQIRVSFSPENQIPAIQKLFGKSGEKLKGKQNRVENQIKILEDIKEVSFEFEIEPSPHN